MKKGFVLINVLVIIIMIGVFSIPVISTNQKETKRKDLFTTYINDVDTKLNDVTEENLESTIESLKKGKNVVCENIILTDDNEILLDNCSIDESAKKYCYYDNEVYNCNSKDYKKVYLGLGIEDDEPSDPVNPNLEYTTGTLLKIEVANGITNNFYVLSETKDTVTAIMDRNYSDNIAWGDYDNNDRTPTIANTKLPTNWTNANEVRLPYVKELISQTEWYKGLTDTSNWEALYLAYTATPTSHEAFLTAYRECGTRRNECFRAAFEAYEEATGDDSILLPTWLDVNLYSTGDSERDSRNYRKDAYWTQDIFSPKPEVNNAWSVSNQGIVYVNGIGYSDDAGVRPVITINKSHIVEKLNAPVYVDGERK